MKTDDLPLNTTPVAFTLNVEHVISAPGSKPYPVSLLNMLDARTRELPATAFAEPNSKRLTACPLTEIIGIKPRAEIATTLVKKIIMPAPPYFSCLK